MNDNQISKTDWDNILELCVDVANAHEKDNELLADEKSKIVVATLDELLAKYGERASLLSVKSNFLEDEHERTTLLEKAYALAEKDNDNYTMAEVAWDLAWQYWRVLEDRNNAKLWNDRLGICLKQVNDDYWQSEYEQMCRDLE